MASDDESVEPIKDAKAKGVKKKAKKEKKKKGKKSKLPKGFVTNSKGEIVSGNEFVLQTALDATQASLSQLRERMNTMYVVRSIRTKIQSNQELQESFVQQEKDSLEVIAALQAENEIRNGEIRKLCDQIEELKRSFSIKEADLKENHEKEMQGITVSRLKLEMKAIIAEKDSAFKVIQQELVVIKDFRKKRHELMRELENQKLELVETDKRHQETITKLERKFFEDKIRLQKEANRKISELAANAHREAVINLEETSKEVFKENQRMSEALRYHVIEGDELNKTNAHLSQTNRNLSDEKEIHNVVVKEKIMQCKQQSQTIRELNLKIQTMEHSLSHVVREFEYEREIIGNLAKKELQEVREVAAKLKSRLERKTREMQHIRRLAQHILDQRTDLEQFFMDSLDEVKQEIQKSKALKRRQAELEYNRQMRQAIFSKNKPIPPVKSFRIQATQKVFSLETEETAESAEDDKVDIKDLKWEDKEKLLRVLFAKMNGLAVAQNYDFEGPMSDQRIKELRSYRGAEYPIGPSAFSGSLADRVDRISTIDHDGLEDVEYLDDVDFLNTDLSEKRKIEVPIVIPDEPPMPVPIITMEEDEEMGNHIIVVEEH